MAKAKKKETSYQRAVRLQNEYCDELQHTLAIVEEQKAVIEQMNKAGVEMTRRALIAEQELNSVKLVVVEFGRKMSQMEISGASTALELARVRQELGEVRAQEVIDEVRAYKP